MKNHKKKQNHIMILTGEASGDYLGATLASELFKLIPNVRLSGIGGMLMRQAGVNLTIDNKDMAIIGAVEILKHLPKLISIKKTLQSIFKQDTPDLIILIDYPGFNLRIAKLAKKQFGIKVLYYVSPQIWAWRYHRIKQIKQYVDHMAVLFPFEQTLYQKEKMPVTFVGHPLADDIITHHSSQALYDQLQLNSKTIITLLPGSRAQEIKSLLPILLNSVRLILKTITTPVEFVLVKASSISSLELNIPQELTSTIKILDNTDLNAILSISHLAIASSGTVTLQTALHLVPTIIIYKVHPLTFWIGKHVVKVPFIGLPNLIAEKIVMPELIQDEATPEAITREVGLLLQDTTKRSEAIDELGKIKAQLGQHASFKTAQIASALITNP